MNYHVFHLINAAAGHNDPLDDAFEWAAIWLIYVLGALAAVPALLRLRTRRLAGVVRVAASLVVAFAAGQALAAVSTEARPFQTHPVHQLIPHAAGGSLPSDHATAAFTMAFAVGTFLSRRWGVALSVLAIILGFARVWTGVHYPADIVAGAIIGAAAVLVVDVGWRLFDRWHLRPPSAAASGR